MRNRRIYLIVLIVLAILVILFLTSQTIKNNHHSNLKNTSSLQMNNFKSSDDMRMLKCWVREQVPKGYDSYGHALQPASISLHHISIQRKSDTWVVYSKDFSGKHSKDKIYHIKVNTPHEFMLYDAKNHKIAVISESDLNKRYKQQTI